MWTGNDHKIKIKKMATCLKMPISNVRAIIKQWTLSGTVVNFIGKGRL